MIKPITGNSKIFCTYFSIYDICGQLNYRVNIFFLFLFFISFKIGISQCSQLIIDAGADGVIALVKVSKLEETLQFQIL